MGLDVISHFSCKDKNRNQIESLLFGWDRSGLHNLLVLTGDYPKPGFQGAPKPVFDLDSVQLKLDNTVVGNHLYTEREINALKRGGVQRFYIGNLTSGEHELVAFFVGKGPKDRDYKRGTTLKITKGTEAQFVELKITDSESKLQPEFKAKVWEAE